MYAKVWGRHATSENLTLSIRTVICRSTLWATGHSKEQARHFNSADNSLSSKKPGNELRRGWKGRIGELIEERRRKTRYEYFYEVAGVLATFQFAARLY